jgi:hypothetical protein
MKIKKTCKGKIKMTLSHKEATVIAKALDNFTLAEKDAIGLDEINMDLFDRDEFEDVEEWDRFEWALWSELDNVLEDYIPY